MRRGTRAAANASPTSGSTPPRWNVSGSHTESNPSPSRASSTGAEPLEGEGADGDADAHLHRGDDYQMTSSAWRRWREQVDLDEYEARFAVGDAVHGEADLVASLAPTSVLDAGCGTGRVAIELARRGIEVVGVDADPDMLERAERQPSRPPVGAGRPRNARRSSAASTSS